MKIVKNLTVKVTYRVELGDVEMSQKVYDQIVEAAENGNDIDPSNPRKYADAANWLSDNIRERDCMDWKAEIKEVS